MLETALGVFERVGRKRPEVDKEQLKGVHAKIGDRSHCGAIRSSPMAKAVANDFLARKLRLWTDACGAR